jgi:hypothetical protein
MAASSRGYNARGVVVADLLECLVQISALGETVGRLERLVEVFPDSSWRHCGDEREGSSALDALACIVLYEDSLDESLRTVLARTPPGDVTAASRSLQAGGRHDDRSAAAMLARFAAQRRSTLAILTHCSAEDLSRTLADPLRGSLQVADLVALTLANDTDRIGQIRTRLFRQASHPPTQGDS